MKAQASRLTLRLSIYVTSAGILSILVNLSANLFSNRSLNTSWYYALIIMLGIASAILGLLQILPAKQQKQQETYQSVPTDLLDDLELEEIRQQVLIRLFSDAASKLRDLPPKQRQAISSSLSDLLEIERLVEAQKQSHPIKVTTEIDGVPITIEAPDVEKAGDMVDLMTQRIQSTSALASKKKAESVIRESTETYKTENKPE